MRAASCPSPPPSARRQAHARTHIHTHTTVSARYAGSAAEVCACAHKFVLLRAEPQVARATVERVQAHEPSVEQQPSL